MLRNDNDVLAATSYEKSYSLVSKCTNKYVKTKSKVILNFFLAFVRTSKCLKRNLTWTIIFEEYDSDVLDVCVRAVCEQSAFFISFAYKYVYSLYSRICWAQLYKVL